FNVPYTRGQTTQDFNQLAREEATRAGAMGERPGDIMRQFDREQVEAMTRARGQVQDTLAGGERTIAKEGQGGAIVGEGIKTTVNGKTLEGPLLVARKSTLAETSFVVIGADQKTSAKLAASAAQRKDSPMGFNEWIQALELDPEKLNDKQMALLQAKFDAEVKAKAEKQPGDIKAKAKPPVADVPKYDLDAVTLAYETHVATVQASAATYAGKIDTAKLAEIQVTAGTKAAELKLQALNDEKPAAWLEVELIRAQAEAEVELIKAERPKGPAIHGSTRDTTPEVIEAAFFRTAGLPDIEKRYKPEVLEASDKIQGFGIQELLLQAAAQSGYSGRSKIGQGNIRQVLEAAFSTHTVTTMLTQLGHKSLLAGYDVVPQKWREVAVTDTVTDFKQMTAFRLTADLEYEELGPAGEIKSGTLGQETYTRQAKTYAKMLAMTRTDIINDDLSAFNDIRNRLGMGCALKVNKEFWTVWLAAEDVSAF
ncbi:hypothetical protein LCGC14_2550940, partial [marine sediment metagenome]